MGPYSMVVICKFSSKELGKSSWVTEKLLTWREGIR